jgi:hypothetical protein
MIPMHLVTREAIALYQRQVAPGGILAFRFSKLYSILDSPLPRLHTMRDWCTSPKTIPQFLKRSWTRESILLDGDGAKPQRFGNNGQ